jgi:hypothetical protein
MPREDEVFFLAFRDPIAGHANRFGIFHEKGTDKMRG